MFKFLTKEVYPDPLKYKEKIEGVIANVDHVKYAWQKELKGKTVEIESVTIKWEETVDGETKTKSGYIDIRSLGETLEVTRIYENCCGSCHKKLQEDTL